MRPAPRRARGETRRDVRRRGALLDAGENERARGFEEVCGKAAGSWSSPRGLVEAAPRLCAPTRRSPAALGRRRRRARARNLRAVSERGALPPARDFRAAAVHSGAFRPPSKTGIRTRQSCAAGLVRSSLSRARTHRRPRIGEVVRPSRRGSSTGKASSFRHVPSCRSAWKRDRQRRGAERLFRETLALAKAGKFGQIESGCLAGLGRLDESARETGGRFRSTARRCLERAMVDRGVRRRFSTIWGRSRWTRATSRPLRTVRGKEEIASHAVEVDPRLRPRTAAARSPRRRGTGKELSSSSGRLSDAQGAGNVWGESASS